MTTTTKSIKALHLEAMEALSSDLFEDGTYNLKTLEACSFDKGFQVTFCNEGDNCTDEKYAFLCSMFSELSCDGETYLGKFGGAPEVSWRFESKKLAKRLARAFNQISIWDWKHSKEIKTGGTGKR